MRPNVRSKPPYGGAEVLQHPGARCRLDQQCAPDPDPRAVSTVGHRVPGVRPHETEVKTRPFSPALSPWVPVSECGKVAHMTVIGMDEFRKKNTPGEGGYDGATCRHCGEAWFRLNGDPVGLVCVSTDGAITGYAGYLYCSSCGRPHRG